MTYQTIIAESIGTIRKITLNRPDRLNACPPEMADELFDAVRDLGDARCVLMEGAGRAFCSGADLGAQAKSSIQGGERSYQVLSKSYNPLMQALVDLPVPLVCAVNGAAAGIGCSIALAADFVVASRSAYFLQAFVNIGLVPDGGSSWTLPRLIGSGRATSMMMLGERIYGEAAEQIGLIYKCVDDDELQAEAMRLADRLSKGPTVALTAMRRNIRLALESDYLTTLRNEAEGQRIAGRSEDAREGMTAFLEKRKPEFKGK